MANGSKKPLEQIIREQILDAALAGDTAVVVTERAKPVKPRRNEIPV